jgi:hypothetical protein
MRTAGIVCLPSCAGLQPRSGGMRTPGTAVPGKHGNVCRVPRGRHSARQDKLFLLEEFEEEGDI